MTQTPPHNLALRSSSGCRSIDIIFPSPFRHAAPSAHPPRLYADDTALLSQSWRPDTISRRLSHAVTTLLHGNLQYIPTELKPNYFPRAVSPPPPDLADPLQIHDNFVPCASSVSYLLLVLRLKNSLYPILAHRRQQSHGSCL